MNASPGKADRHSPRRPLVLASASPRRSELLAQIGIPFTVMPAGIDESAATYPSGHRRADPVTLACDLALLKAQTVAARMGEAPQPWVLGADTVVVCEGLILEKPADRNDAARMLSLMSGRSHTVVTGCVFVRPQGEEIVHHCATSVTFREMAGDEIAWYLDTGEWEGVAGAYRIQGACARFVERIAGSYSNVVGLPLHLVYSILRKHNWFVPDQDIPSDS